MADCDFIILGGDLNARIGTCQDFLQDIDEISPRQPLDLVKNSHGTDFINFLLEAKMCTINGRIPAKGQKQVISSNVVSNTGDNYTSISSKGKAIVDYLFTAHSNIKQINCCNVLTITDLCNKFAYQGDKLPDHSVIMCTVNLRQWDSNLIDQRVLTSENKATNSATDLNLRERISYNMSKLSPHFTVSEDCQNAINRTVTKLQYLQMNIQLINDLYNEIINILNMEMSNRWLHNTSNNKKKKRLSKPWWNEDLSNAWRAMVQGERNFMKKKQSSADRQLLHK